MPLPVRVRRIGPDEGPLLRSLRLRSLEDSPEAFGEPLPSAEARPRDDWEAMARAGSRGDRRAWFVAERESGTGTGTEPVGVVLGRRRPPDCCLLFSMWVDPSARGTGVGRMLLRAVEDWAASWGAREVVLWVFESNVAAIRLYENAGFERVDAGPDAEAGRSWNARAMRRRLREAPRER